MQNEKSKLYVALLIPSLLIVVLWLAEAYFYFLSADRSIWGVFPRSIHGLSGILTMPFVHGDWEHLLSNSIPLGVLMSGILYLYQSIAWPVIGLSYLVPSMLVWFFARANYHIGASGMIFAFAFFLFFSGILRKETRTLALSLMVAFLYGGMIWGVFPGQVGISWEGHLFGALTGLVVAIIFRNKGPQKTSRWQEEEERPDDRYDIWNYKELFPPPEGMQYPEK